MQRPSEAVQRISLRTHESEETFELDQDEDFKGHEQYYRWGRPGVSFLWSSPQSRGCAALLCEIAMVLTGFSRYRSAQYQLSLSCPLTAPFDIDDYLPCLALLRFLSLFLWSRLKRFDDCYFYFLLFGVYDIYGEYGRKNRPWCLLKRIRKGSGSGKS